MIATAPFVPEEECYVVCYCARCDGASWHDFDEVTTHLDTLTDGVEIELINVGLS